MKFLLEYNKFRQRRNIESEEVPTLDMNFNLEKEEEKPFVADDENEEYIDYNIEYSKKDLIKVYNHWRIKWNHTKSHDMLDRINKRAKCDIPCVNDKIEKILDYIENKYKYFESGNYNFTLRLSGFMIAINLDKFGKRIYIHTILGKDMRIFKDIVDDVIMLENIRKSEIIFIDL